MMQSLHKCRLPGAALLLGLASAAPAQDRAAPAAPLAGVRTEAVAAADGFFRMGQLEAPLQVTEFISYTCPRCATFAAEAEGALELGYIGSGKVSLTFRPMVRDPIDTTATLLVGCGGPSRFRVAHAAFMRAQPQWLELVNRAPATQRSAWLAEAPTTRTRQSIAAALGFYRLAERAGISRVAADRCLADTAKIAALEAGAEAARSELGVPGTPSFALNGMLLLATHDWTALRLQLDARLAAPPADGAQ